MRCNFCDKTSKMHGLTKKLRGHINPTGKRWRRANIQWFRLPDGSRVKACTKCIKARTKSPRAAVNAAK